MRYLLVTTMSLAATGFAGQSLAAERIREGGRDHPRAPVRVSTNVDTAKVKQIPEDQARATALQHVPGTVKEVELEHEHGMLVYSIEIKTKDGKTQEVKIDAATGAFRGTEEEKKDDEKGDD